MFLLWGVRGQRIIVDPRSQLVIVNAAVHQQAIDLRALEEMWAVSWAFVKRFGG
jgi:hypothetical protein